MVLATLAKFQVLAADAVKINPDPSALPGVPAAEKLLDGLAKYILIAAAVGALLGLGQWVLGSRSNNYSQADSGRTKVAVAIGAAFLVGALPAVINFFLAAGGEVK